jgi:hypothetical protein
LLSEAVAKDTRKLGTAEAFLLTTSPEIVEEAATLRSFAEKRAAFLLGHAAIEALPEESVQLAQVLAPRTQVKAEWPRVESPLSITEIMAVEANDASGIRERSTDWIEVYNGGGKTIDLTDHFLSDDPSNPEKWGFPKGLKIVPEQYLLIWADNSKGPGLHANFKLSKRGEHLVLSHQGAILSELIFPRQTLGRSFGRSQGELRDLMPTPATPNRTGDGDR